jgi:hypothetical protein
MKRMKTAANGWREGGGLVLRPRMPGRARVSVDIGYPSWMVVWQGAFVRSVTPTGEMDEHEGMEWHELVVSHDHGETWFTVQMIGEPELE